MTSKVSSFVKNCPRCGKEQKYHNEDTLVAAQRKNSICLSCAAKARPKLYGKKNHNHKHDKLERICHTCKSIIKYKSLGSFMKARRKNSGCKPCALTKNRRNYYRYNPKACEFFDLLNKRLKWKGRHALDGGEHQVLWFFVDYYEPDLNLVIEYDEAHHKYQAASDKIRQEKIEKKLNCQFIRISSGLDFNEAIDYISRGILCH